jgi:hypothetical protein
MSYELALHQGILMAILELFRFSASTSTVGFADSHSVEFGTE